MTINGIKIDDIEVEGSNLSDSPDFCDAYISRAVLVAGRELSETELEELNKDDMFVLEQVQQALGY